jgi:hypothetical protein
MQNTFSHALSKAIGNHILLSWTRRETLACLAHHAAGDDLPVAPGVACGDGCQEPSWLENIELCAKKAIKRENVGQ